MKLNTFTGRISDGDIRLLRIFCTVVRCGGFAAAESELQLGLPSISRYVKDLETRLGVRLCRRGRTGFSLTDEGRHVYASSLHLISNIEQFEANIRSIHTELRGTLEIGVIDAVLSDPAMNFPEILSEFHRRYPSVEFHLTTATSNVIEQSVLDGTLHVGMVIGRRHINQLDHRLLYREHGNLYCAPNHPLYNRNDLTVEEVTRYNKAGYSFLAESDRFRFSELPQTAAVDTTESVAMMIASGQYLGTLPDHYVKTHWRLQKLKPILPEVFGTTTDIELIARRDTSSPRTLALLEIVDAMRVTSLHLHEVGSGGKMG